MPEFDILSGEFFANPYPVFSAMRNQAPCYYDHRLEAHIITRFHDVERALKDAEVFSSMRVEQWGKGAPDHMLEKLEYCNRELKTWMVFNVAPYHTSRRARLLKSFGPHLLPRIREIARRVVSEVLDEIDGSKEQDLVKTFTTPVATRMLVDVLGIPREHVEQIKSWTTDVFALQGAGIASEHAVESGYRACTGFRAFCTELVRQRREEPRDDLLSALARVDPEDESAGINEADVVGLAILMLAAGHESSTNLLGNSIYHVLSHPEARAWVIEHQGVTEDHVEEFARYETPFMSLIRRAKKPVLFSGKMVREGEYVFCMLSSANRDPRAFTQPDRLALDAAPRAHVGFSVGIHKCAGAFMARVVISQAVTQFFARYPDAKFNPEGCRWLNNLSTRGLAQFPVLPAG